MLKLCKIEACANGTLGLHLSRAPWDPYPWVSDIQRDSNAYLAGMRTGDTVLEMNGCDVLGQKISEIAANLRLHWQSGGSDCVTVVIWRNKTTGHTPGRSTNGCDAGDANEDEDDEETNAHNINQQSLQKFATCLQHIAQLLECPVCLEVIRPPGWQCCNGHVLCNNCRSRSVRCPVCRVPLGPRGRCLLSDKLFSLLAESFPCDGVRANNNRNSNKNSPKDERKCLPEFRNHRKMVIRAVQPDDGMKAKELKKKLKLSSRQQESFNSSSYGNGTNNDNGHGHGHGHGSCSSGKGEPEGGIVDKSSLRARWLRASPSRTVHQLESSESCSPKLAEGTAEVRSSVVGARWPESRINNEGDVPESSIHDRNVLVKLKLKSGNRKATTAQPTPTLGSGPTTRQPSPGTTVGVVAKLDSLKEHNHIELLHSPDHSQCCCCCCRCCRCCRHPPSESEKVRQRHNEKREGQVQEMQVRRNYQCPTGKSCCKYNVMAHNAVETHIKSNNNLWTTRWRHESAESAPTNSICDFGNSPSSCLSPTTGRPTWAVTEVRDAVGCAAPQTFLNNSVTCSDCCTNNSLSLHSEWQILIHLSDVHQLPITHYYGRYGQRIRVHLHDACLTCVSLRGAARAPSENEAHEEKFFLVRIPLSDDIPSQTKDLRTTGKMAVFLWHLNAITGPPPAAAKAEGPIFETIIESQRTGVKWFGTAHPLTTSWHNIRSEGHFLMHDVSPSDTFVLVVRRK